MFICLWCSWLSSEVKIVDRNVIRAKNVLIHVTSSRGVPIMKVNDKAVVVGDRESHGEQGRSVSNVLL